VGTLSLTVRNAFLNALCRNASYANAAVWVQLHVGDPGSAGTINVASNTSRQQVTFGNAATTGTITNTADLVWATVPAQETYTHVTMWTASTVGTMLGSDQLLNPASMQIGDTFRLPTGDVTLTSV
jgi:hypothetical protein